MGIKIIFTDVDGVLNTSRTQRRLCVSDTHMFVDTRKVLRLRDIVERTGAKLVLSSSWRLGAMPNSLCLDREALRELAAEFRRVRCPLWSDVTPYLPRAKRWQEINAWLMNHDIDDFIILDDVGEELKPFTDKLVLTNMHDGLTKERAELAVKMLGEVENEQDTGI